MNISVANSRSRRETVFPILTLLVALVWAGGTWKVAAHVKGINSFRATLAVLTAGMSGNRSPQSIPFRPLFPGLSVPVQPNPPDETLKTLRHSGCVEAVVFVWQIIISLIYPGSLNLRSAL